MTDECKVCSTVPSGVLSQSNEIILSSQGGGSRAGTGATGAKELLTSCGYTFGFHTIRKHAAHLRAGVATPKQATSPKKQSCAPVLNTDAKVDIHENGEGTIKTGETFETAANWDNLLASFGIDPETVLVKGDTIRMSARTVKFINEDGTSGERVARSFSAAFMPRPAHWISDDVIEALGKKVRARGTKKVVLPEGDSTYLVCLADLQLGKSEGGGVAATIERFNQAMDAVVANYVSLKKQGFKFEKIALAQMGDLLEGCSGSYDSQTFTVELNQRRQVKIGLEIMIATIDRLLKLGLPVHVVSVNSNHGSWMRRGGKANITSTSDTSDGAIHDALHQVYRNDEQVTFTALNDEAVISASFSGVNVGFSHGHLTTSAQAGRWLDDQERVLARLKDFPVNVFVTAHSHHFRQADLGAYQWLQCPALDGGSQWFEDARGRWSTAGMLTAVLGSHLPTGVAEVKCQWATRAHDENVAN
jgi:hypothetical protein